MALFALARSCFGAFVVTLNEVLVNEQLSDVSLLFRCSDWEAMPEEANDSDDELAASVWTNIS